MGFILIFEFGIPLKISKIISNRKTIFPLSGMKNWSRTDIEMRLLSILYCLCLIHRRNLPIFQIVITKGWWRFGVGWQNPSSKKSRKTKWIWSTRNLKHVLRRNPSWRVGQIKAQSNYSAYSATMNSPTSSSFFSSESSIIIVSVVWSSEPKWRVIRVRIVTGPLGSYSLSLKYLAEILYVPAMA